jgi:endonuclease YncB( thermonuclease family)
MYGFLVLCGWAVAAAVVALAWVGWRPGRRLVTGMVIGAVTGLLWPITLWAGVGALISQRRRRSAAVRSPGFTVATVLGCTIASFATLGVVGAMAPAPAAAPVASAMESTDPVAAAEAPAADRAVVTAVVDGDTVDVDIDGRAVRIGMLNIHAPELSAPEEDRSCLGPEAAELVSSLIPVGANVLLEYDQVRTDRDGRTLAGVFTDGGVLVNAEVARAGLAAAVVVDGNARFLPAVESAQREAAEAGRGLYGAESACTLPGRTQAVTTALAAVPAAATLPAGAIADDIDRMAGDAAQVVALAAGTRDRFTAARDGVLWDVYGPQDHVRFAAEATAAWESAVRVESELRDAATAARTREADAARAAEEAEAARAEAARVEAARVEAARAEAARAEEARAEEARAEEARAEEARKAERRRAAAAAERPAPAASAEGPAPAKESTGGGRVVHPGSFCDKAGASGVTKKGTAMRCQLDSKGERLRWSAA